MPKISDYSNFDYQTEYWVKADRRYEHLAETQTIRKILKKNQVSNAKILDAGCGFGRLQDSYREFGRRFFLADYAINLLKDSDSYKKAASDTFQIGCNLYELPLKPGTADIAISVRVLHHLQNPAAYFREIARVLASKGLFILEVPNKCHLLNRLRFALGRGGTNPYDHQPYTISETFINYHPDHIHEILRSFGFHLLEKQSTSFFRLSILKRIFSPYLLAYVDKIFQSFLSNFDFTPSSFLILQKN